MNIYAYELRKRLSSMLVWALSVGAFVFFYFSFFDTFADQALMDLMDSFPDAFKKAFGFQSDFTTLMGFFGAVSLLVLLCGALFSCRLGIDAVSAEERDLTADFLIPKPVKRTTILTAKILSGLTHIIGFTVITSAVSLASIEVFGGGGEYDSVVFALICLSVLVIQVLFYAVGLFISVCLRRMDSPFPFAFGIPVLLFVVNSFETLLSDTFLKYLVPFDYFNPAQIVEDTSLKTYGVVVSLALSVVFISSTFVLFRRRNIATAM